MKLSFAAKMKQNQIIKQAIFALIATCFIASVAFGQAPDTLDNGGLPQKEAYSLAQTDTSHYAKLSEKVKAEGKIRIIVGVKASFKPEGYHAAPEGIAEQRTGIAKAQEKLLKSVQIHDETEVLSIGV